MAYIINHAHTNNDEGAPAQDGQQHGGGTEQSVEDLQGRGMLNPFSFFEYTHAHSSSSMVVAQNKAFRACRGQACGAF